MSVAFRSGCRIGIDVGGTFTDFVLANGTTAELVRYKEPSVPEDPSLSVERGLPALIARAGVAASDIGLIVHGTTLALNAIIQRRGARLGLVVSRGNRGVLEIGRAQLANAFSFALQKEEPLVPRKLVLETGARLLRDGTIHAGVDQTELASIARTFRDARVDAVTVMLLHSYANPQFEQEVAQSLRAQLPGIPVTASASIWPEQREFERCLVALLNSYIQPIMSSYLELLQHRVKSFGIDAPIYITTNNGGTLSIPTARERPIDTILSGPASGVVAASAVARLTGHKHYITVDMGGTSADMSMVQDGHPEHTTRTHIGELPLMVPVVNVSAIGAGGGSIVWVDKQGVLKVGPQSAGAVPGPVCYGCGGTEATVTDCYLIAGLIDGEQFLGGRVKLDVAAAARALEGVADRIGITGEDRAIRAADAALRVMTAVMATEVTKNVAQRGENIRDYALVPFGGAGPTQANLIAEDCNIHSIIVPATPSTFCALGALLADVKRDYVRSKWVNLDDAEAGVALHSVFEELEADAEEWIGSEGSILGTMLFEHVLEMRYTGQAYDLPVALTPALRQSPDPDALRELFHQAHERAYSFRDPASGVEVTTVRVRVVGKVPDIGLPNNNGSGPAVPVSCRRFYWNGAYRKADVYRRGGFRTGVRMSGPAIVEQEDTTTLVLPGWAATVDEIGNLVIARAP